MRKLVLPLAFCAAVGLMSAQEDAEFSKSMKTIGKNMNALKGMEMKTGPEAADSAAKIAAAYKVTEAYWTKNNVTDAAKWTQEASGFADDLAAAAKAGEQEKAAAAYKSLGGTCKGCHDAHREKVGEGSYKIK